MPLDNEARFEVSAMIEAFHRQEVLPLHRENLGRMDRVEKVLTTLVDKTEERKLVLAEVDKAKNIKLRVIIALLGLIIGYLTYLATVQVNQKHAVLNVSQDPTIAAER